GPRPSPDGSPTPFVGRAAVSAGMSLTTVVEGAMTVAFADHSPTVAETSLEAAGSARFGCTAGGCTAGGSAGDGSAGHGSPGAGPAGLGPPRLVNRSQSAPRNSAEVDIRPALESPPADSAALAGSTDFAGASTDSVGVALDGIPAAV